MSGEEKSASVTYTELVKEVATLSAVNRDVAKDVCEALGVLILNHVWNGRSVRMHGFLNIEVAARDKRKAYRPTAGDTVTVPRRRIVRARAMKNLRDTECVIDGDDNPAESRDPIHPLLREYMHRRDGFIRREEKRREDEKRKQERKKLLQRRREAKRLLDKSRRSYSEAEKTIAECNRQLEK